MKSDNEINYVITGNHNKIKDYQYRAIVESQTDLICRFLPDTTLTFVNKAYCNYFGKKSEELIGTKFLTLVPEKDHDFILKKLISLNVDNNNITYEHRVIDKKGEISWQKWTDQAFFDENEEIIEYQSIGTDITNIKMKEEDLLKSYNEVEKKVLERAKELEYLNKKMQNEINAKIIIEKELRQSEERYRKLVEFLPDGIVVHINGKIIFVNTYFAKILGTDNPEELVEKNLLEFLHPSYHKMAREHVKYVNMDKPVEFVEEKIIRLDGKIIDIEASGIAFPYEGESAILVIIRDISGRKKAEKKIEHMAYYDSLTGLPNCYLFKDYLRKALHCTDYKENRLAVMFIDLDRFKIINDTMGHTFGDIVLNKVSKKLLKCVSKDTVVSRYGGDEFIILLSYTNEKEVIMAAQRIVEEFNKSISINEHEIFMTVSMGISLYPIDGDDIETLIKCADLAMYSVKENGKNNFKFYISNLSKKVSRKMYMENGLRKALVNDEFVLFYQPQFDLDTGEIIGMEALIRWKHPEYGLISPLEFIPLAEETGLIIPIGKWVLKTACKQNKIWYEAGISNVYVAVNISVRQFQQKNFVEIVKQVLKETQLQPKQLKLEITESIMQNITKSTKILNELKDIGVQVSIDDFGTGYSSLSVLQYLPVDTLKIDKSFVNGIDVDTSTTAIVRTIIDMGNNLRINVIAEGIENREQVEYLKQNKCFMGQGYYFSKPLSAEKVEKLLKNRRNYNG